MTSRSEKGKGKETLERSQPPSLFKLEGYPLDKPLPCHTEQAGIQAPNVTSIFLPSKLTAESRSLLDFPPNDMDPGLKVALLLLDLCLKSLDHFSGTRYRAPDPSSMQHVPDWTRHCAEELNPDAGKMERL